LSNKYTVADIKNSLDKWNEYVDLIKQGLPVERWIKNEEKGYLPDFLGNKEKIFAQFLLNNKELNKGSTNSSDGISGFIVDASFLWEMYLYNLMNLRLSDWDIDSQKSFAFYEDTFYTNNNYPDLVLTNRKTGDILVFDAKFKRMTFDERDVDNNDIRQIHFYSYRFHLEYGEKFKGAGLIYPTKIDVSSEKRTSDSMFGLERTKQKFGIFTIKDPGEIGDIRKSEDNFIENMLTFLNA